jgi:hypothetical protein
MYLTTDGTQHTLRDIRDAHQAGKALLIHSHAPAGGIRTSLHIGDHIDTRNVCYSVWDQVWTTAPESLKQILKAAYC